MLKSTNHFVASKLPFTRLSVKTIILGIFFALVLHAFAAYFSLGYAHPDEYFQTVEFAASKLGLVSTRDLPYEFQYAARPWLQPWFFSLVLTIGNWISSDPFFGYFLCRLSMSILGCAATLIFALVYIEKENDGKSQMYCERFWWWIVFCPFFYFFHARTSSENFASSLFLIALSVLYWNRDKHSNAPSGIQTLTAFFLLGLAFQARYQLILSIAGIYLWILFYARSKLNLVSSVMGFLMTLPILVAVDSLGYGRFVFAPWNYFELGILHGAAKNFGVLPVWGYWTLMQKTIGVIFSFILISVSLFWTYQNKKSLLVWSFVPFVVGHCFIGHKELRFLFPVAPIAMIALYNVLYRKVGPSIESKSLKMQKIILVPVGLTIGIYIFQFVFTRQDALAKVYEEISKTNRTESPPIRVIVQNSVPMFGYEYELLPRYLLGSMKILKIPENLPLASSMKNLERIGLPTFVFAEGDRNLPLIQELHRQCQLHYSNDLKLTYSYVGQFAPNIWENYWNNRNFMVRELFVCKL